MPTLVSLVTEIGVPQCRMTLGRYLSVVESVTHYIADICGVLLIVGGTR